MAKEAVILKSNPYGLILNLNPELTFEELLKGVAQKFQSTGRFFKNATLALTFRGRELSREEELALVEVIVEYAKIQVLSIVDEDPETEERYKSALLNAIHDQDRDAKLFHKGTLKHGDTLETESSVVILGDVNPGAKVVSQGNIVVLGCLMGTVHAGCAGNQEAFVAALTMKPFQLAIADRTFRSAIVKKEDTGEYPIDPKIVFIKDDQMNFSPISKETYKEYLGVTEND